MAKWAILESWCYTRRNGAASILAESRSIPGNSRWCSAWLNPRESGGILSYTSGQQAEVVLLEVLRLYQGSVVDCIYQVKSRFCLYQVTSKILFIPGHFQDSVYTRSLPRVCLYQVVFFYSHQRPWGGECLGGRYTPVERLRWRLRDGLREARLLGDDARWGRLVSPISTTVGGWAWRPKAAASGRAASIATLVSGRWARGSSGYTTPGLSL